MGYLSYPCGGKWEMRIAAEVVLAGASRLAGDKEPWCRYPLRGNLSRRCGETGPVFGGALPRIHPYWGGEVEGRKAW